MSTSRQHRVTVQAQRQRREFTNANHTTVRRCKPTHCKHCQSGANTTASHKNRKAEIRCARHMTLNCMHRTALLKQAGRPNGYVYLAQQKLLFWCTLLHVCQRTSRLIGGIVSWILALTLPRVLEPTCQAPANKDQAMLIWGNYQSCPGSRS